MVHPAAQDFTALGLTVAKYVDDNAYSENLCGLTFQVAQFINFGRHVTFVVRIDAYMNG